MHCVLLLQGPLFKNDIVEYHCESSHGISPWLEARVSDCAGANFRLAGVIRSDPKRLVPRASLRLVERGRGHLFRRFRVPTDSKCVVM